MDPPKAKKAKTMPTWNEVMDPYGDITLVVGAEKGSIRCARNILCLSSPVMKKMLDPESRFTEANTNVVSDDGTKHIQLPEDEYKPLILVLRIVHHKVKDLPKKISFELLAGIAVVCDKYDLLDCIHHWTDSWSDYASESEDRRWLFVAFVLKIPKAFRDITRSIILDSEESEGGDFDIGDSYTDGVPEWVLKRLAACRSRAIRRLITMAEGFAHARVSGKTIACQARHDTGSQNVCDADILTHLTETFPEFFNSQHSESTSKYRRLEKMSINTWIKPLKKARRTGEVTSSSSDWLEWYWHSVVHFKCELKHSLLPKMLKVIEDLKGLLLDPPFRLFVKTLTGKTMLIDETFSASTVYEIKDILWELYGAPPDQQRLIFAGKQLRDDQTMTDCGIRPESTLHLVLSLRGCDCGCDVRETWDESAYAESTDAPENVALEDTLQDEESESTQQNDDPEDILQNNERGDLEKYDESEDTAQVDERKEIPHNAESDYYITERRARGHFTKRRFGMLPTFPTAAEVTTRCVKRRR